MGCTKKSSGASPEQSQMNPEQLCEPDLTGAIGERCPLGSKASKFFEGEGLRAYRTSQVLLGDRPRGGKAHFN
jgi:hypothetical protein